MSVKRFESTGSIQGETKNEQIWQLWGELTWQKGRYVKLKPQKMDSAHNFGPILKVSAMLQGPPGRRSEPCEKHSNKDTSGQGAIVSTVPHFLPPSFYPLTSKPGWFWGWGSSKTWVLHVHIILATGTYELLCNIIPNISICVCLCLFRGGGRVFFTYYVTK